MTALLEEAAAAARALDAAMAQRDPDRWLAARFAPAAARLRLSALHGFNHELARAGEVTAEPMIAAIRLAWWREVLDELDAGPDAVRRHETALAMAATLGVGDLRPTRAMLEGLVDARDNVLEDVEPPADMAALTAQVDQTAGALVLAAAACLAPPEHVDEAARRALSAVGRAWGLVGVARSFAALARRGRPPVSADTLKALGMTRQKLSAAGEPALARRALTPLLDAAEEALDTARAHRRDVPAALWPAAGYGVLARVYLKRLRARDYNPYADAAELALLGRQARLTWAAATGAIA